MEPDETNDYDDWLHMLCDELRVQCCAEQRHNLAKIEREVDRRCHWEACFGIGMCDEESNMRSLTIWFRPPCQKTPVFCLCCFPFSFLLHNN